jgi:hypothetical protein
MNAPIRPPSPEDASPEQFLRALLPPISGHLSTTRWGYRTYRYYPCMRYYGFY